MQGSVEFQVMAAIAAVVLGLGGLVRGVQMRKGRLDLISDWDNQPLPNPSEHAPAYAGVYVRLGAVILISPLALWAGVPLLVWGIAVGVLVWYWFEAIDRISAHAREKHRLPASK
jgi:hypothetical protein